MYVRLLVIIAGCDVMASGCLGEPELLEWGAQRCTRSEWGAGQQETRLILQDQPIKTQTDSI